MGVMEEAWGLEGDEEDFSLPSETAPAERVMRHFESGATRNSDDDKLDYEGYLSPRVLEEFGCYMYEHGNTPEGRRASDNWQKGFGREVILKSLVRHVMDLWLLHRANAEIRVRPDGEEVGWHDALGGAFFNLQALWHERIKEVDNDDPS